MKVSYFYSNSCDKNCHNSYTNITHNSNYTNEELNTLLHNTFENENKVGEFMQRSLRSGLDILKHGGSVTNIYKDRVFKMHYDNRRVLEDDYAIDRLRDSKPVYSKDVAELNRFVSKLPTCGTYNKTISSGKTHSTYKNKLDVLVRNFIKGLFSKSHNLDISAFNNYQELVDFLSGYTKITVNNIASIKRRPLNNRKILLDKDDELVIGFLNHISEKFPDFNKKSFLEGV